MIEVYKYLEGAENYGHLSKEERQRTNNERQTNSDGKSGRQF